MKVTVLNDVGTMYDLEIDPQMSLENMMALLEAESGIPVIEQSLSLDGRELSDGKAPMATLGVQDNCVLLIRRKVTTVGGRPVEHDSEMMRLQLLGDPDVMRQLRTVQPDLVDAAVNDPGRFAELLRQTRARHADAEFAQQREVERLNANPFDIEAQRRIEEAIREQAVMENMQHAIEFSPESFGRVTMLYIPVEVNGVSVKAFVDSGAQQTIMSPECAERCNIMRLLDRRFAGVARGVGTAAILGRVHSAQLKLADLHLPCAFTIMEGRDVDLLFGLDMLKQHQACIDLDKNVLRINGREVTFLAEHELPEQARMMERPIDLADTNTSAGPSSIPSGSQPQFPGSGHALGNQPAGNSGRQGPPAPTNPSRYPESAIQTLIDLGATREVAIRTLDAAGGNVDYAASMLF